MDWAGARCGADQSLLPTNFLGILLGRDGANYLLHHRIRYSHRLRLLYVHLEGSDLSGSAQEAVPLETEEVDKEAQFRCSEVCGLAEALQASSSLVCAYQKANWD